MSRDRLSILHVAPTFPLEGRGGLERQVLDIATVQSSRNDVTVLAFSEKGSRKENIGFSLIRVLRGPRSQDDYGDRNPELEDAFAKATEGMNADIVHIHLSNLSSELVSMAKRIAPVVVVSLHDYMTICPIDAINTKGEFCLSPGAGCLSCVNPPMFSRKRLLGYWRLTNPVLSALDSVGLGFGVGPILKQLRNRKERYMSALKQADCVIVPSKSAVENFAESGLKTRSVLPGIHLPAATWSRSDKRVPIRFGVIGGNRNKGVLVALRAFSHLESNKAELYVYGKPCYPHDSQKIVLDLLDQPGIKTHDMYEPDNIDEVFGSFDVLIAPSIVNETFGLVAVEAVIRGIPVIASDSGGFLETIIDGENGLLFKTGNHLSLARAMTLLIEEQGLYERLSSWQGKIKTVEEQSDEIEKVYREFL